MNKRELNELEKSIFSKKTDVICNLVQIIDLNRRNDILYDEVKASNLVNYLHTGRFLD